MPRLTGTVHSDRVLLAWERPRVRSVDQAMQTIQSRKSEIWSGPGLAAAMSSFLKVAGVKFDRELVAALNVRPEHLVAIRVSADQVLDVGPALREACVQTGLNLLDLGEATLVVPTTAAGANWPVTPDELAARLGVALSSERNGSTVAQVPVVVEDIWARWTPVELPFPPPDCLRHVVMFIKPRNSRDVTRNRLVARAEAPGPLHARIHALRELASWPSSGFVDSSISQMVKTADDVRVIAEGALTLAIRRGADATLIIEAARRVLARAGDIDLEKDGEALSVAVLGAAVAVGWTRSEVHMAAVYDLLGDLSSYSDFANCASEIREALTSATEVRP